MLTRKTGGKLLIATLLGWLLAGCAPMAITGAPDVNKAAFGAKKRFAVVSIASLKTFQGERSMADTFKSADQVAGANTQPLLNKLQPKIIKALDKAPQFTLVPESRVLTHRAYRSLAEDERSMKVLFITADMNVAHNYRYFSEPQKYAKLAKDLGVDGVIGVTVTFSIRSGGGGVNINGLSFGKKSYSAVATVGAVAYNQQGEVIWKDSAVREAEPGDSKAVIVIDTTAFTGADFEKFHPSAVEIGAKAVDMLMARFDDTMAGKEVSSFQSYK
jgi:hypothetical protein